jgi:hypothetical protein
MGGYQRVQFHQAKGKRSSFYQWQLSLLMVVDTPETPLFLSLVEKLKIPGRSISLEHLVSPVITLPMRISTRQLIARSGMKSWVYCEACDGDVRTFDYGHKLRSLGYGKVIKYFIDNLDVKG